MTSSTTSQRSHRRRIFVCLLIILLMTAWGASGAAPLINQLFADPTKPGQYRLSSGISHPGYASTENEIPIEDVQMNVRQVEYDLSPLKYKQSHEPWQENDILP